MLFSSSNHLKILLLIVIMVIASVIGTSIIYGKNNINNNQEYLVIECDSAQIQVSTVKIINITYEWIHSVEGTPIIETYKIMGDNLVLIEARAQSFGAGHPYSSEEIGGNSIVIENNYIIYKANYTIGPSLEILGHEDYNGTLVVYLADGSKIACTEFVHATINILDRD